jgi:hypothetical protein
MKTGEDAGTAYTSRPIRRCGQKQTFSTSISEYDGGR